MKTTPENFCVSVWQFVQKFDGTLTNLLKGAQILNVLKNSVTLKQIPLQIRRQLVTSYENKSIKETQKTKKEKKTTKPQTTTLGEFYFRIN